MRYTITYQERPGPHARPIDDGRDLCVEANDKNGFALIPNIGDYVSMNVFDDSHPTFSGKVTGRLFSYFLSTEGEPFCSVNIIVDSSEKVPDLIKE